MTNSSQIDFLFTQKYHDEKIPAMYFLFPLLLYFIGIGHWLIFLHYGNLTFISGDWPQEYTYYTVFKKAFQEATIPYHVSKRFHGTFRFFGVPETLLSPQLIVLAFMTIPKFIVFNILFLYTLGFIGCLWIKNRYSLSLFSFAILFLLFNFNGHIIAHLSAGHSMWCGYFLLPFFFFYVLELIDRANVVTAIKLAIILFLLLLHGSLHMYVWCLILLGLIALFHRKYIRYCFIAITLSGLLGAFRMLPTGIALWNKKQNFLSGYPTLDVLLKALVEVHPPDTRVILHWWEYNLYLGWIGLTIIIFSGIYLRIYPKPEITGYTYRNLDGPLVTMAILSMSYFYAPIFQLPIPLLNSERVTSRFLIIPVLLLLIIGCIRLSSVVYRACRQKPLLLWLSIAAIIQMAIELFKHSWAWRIIKMERSISRKVNFSVDIVEKHDPVYMAALIIGIAISTITTAGIVAYLKFSKKQSVCS